MKTLFLATAAALAFSAAPASAQLLGGGGLGGTIGGGGSLGGLGGTLDRVPATTIDRVREPVTTNTRSTTRADGNARASSNVDRRSGRVAITGGGDANGNSALDGAAGALAPAAGGTASGSAEGNANADLIGTDDVRSVAGGATNTVRGAVGRTRDLATGARDRARNAVGRVGNPAGSIAGGGAMGSANGSAGNGVLALSGSSAADAIGSFAVAPGMQVTDLRGRTIGTVRTLVTDARGRVQAVRMEVGKKLATVPAANFSGSGDVLISAASKGEIKDMAEDQSAH